MNSDEEEERFLNKNFLQKACFDGLVDPLTEIGDLLAPVVKIYSNHVDPSYCMPWQMTKQQRSTSSGLVISGRRILTNAHSIEFQTSVLVRKYSAAEKYQARVLHVGFECDLALITVDDESFWENLPYFEFGTVPNLQDSVVVVGYPTGGDNVSVTKGVVSRIDVQEYSYGNFQLLAIQIDAAINAGNSGGPAIKGNKVVGVAFETLNQAENIGYIIPVPVIEHFLSDLQTHNKYTGFCVLGINWQKLESPQLKSYFKLTTQNVRKQLNSMKCQKIDENPLARRPVPTGILVNQVHPLSPASQASLLKTDDIILAIDGVAIADDGTIAFRRG